MELEFIRQRVRPADTKIVLLVMDGLGGLPGDGQDFTELEAANTPNLDALAAEGVCGLHRPIGAGITPGSGPAHLGLFGYDPIRYQVGRGVLSALGVQFDLQPGDVAARGNFCTMDDSGKVTDRRAGRIPTETGAALCEKLSKIEIPGVELFVKPVKEYRFTLILRGDGLGGDLADTDPQQTGKEALKPRALNGDSEKTAELVGKFVDAARDALKGDAPANMVLMRGFSRKPDWPQFPEVFGVRAAAIAAYPMYRGVAKLVGMDVLAGGDNWEQELVALESNWKDYDFFFIHFKKTDSAGEDGDYEKKRALIEELDATIPRITGLNPDVILVTGDHSTPSQMKSHSWHPVPVLLWSRLMRKDGVETFGERACLAGALGPHIPARELMPLAVAHAGRLEKFGA
ncbi:MAG: 2,3-bisphosphoglycerate-independent phosphoglycerate mutase [Desulfococcaceae bacterium]